MASIQRLEVSGIRSFAPGDPVAIDFKSPLTIIVGANGTGKTTIIECLKYITTGILPPNTRGGGFIHDPDLVKENQVYGRMMLSYTSNDGSHYTCQRTLMLSCSDPKKGSKVQTRSVKTFEGVLSRIILGERNAVPMRVTNLDAEVPLSLGVSRSVLENVIFCHQDDSFWPLSDPATLKKKFDELFDAQKYSKFIEDLHAFRKTLQTDLKLAELELQHLLAECDRSRKKKNELDNLENSKVKLESKFETLQQQIKTNTEAQEELSKLNQDFFAILAKADQIRLETNFIDSSCKDLLKSGLTLLDQDQLAKINSEPEVSIDEHLQILTQRKNDLKEEENANTEAIAQIQRDLSKNQIVLGQKQSELKTLEKQEAEIHTEVNMLSKKYSLSPVDSSEGLKERITFLMNSLKEENSRIQEEMTETTTKESRLYQQIQSLLQSIESLKLDQNQYRQEIRILRNTLDKSDSSINGSESLTLKEDYLKKEIEQYEEKLSVISSKLDSYQQSDAVFELQQTITKLETQLEMLSIDSSNKSGFLDLSKKYIEGEITKLIHALKLSEFDDAKDYSELLSIHKKYIHEHRQKLKDLIGCHSQAISDLSLINKQIDGDYRLNKSSQIKDLEKDIADLEFGLEYYSQAKENLQVDGICSLCEKEPSNLSNFISKVDERASEISKSLESLKKELSQAESAFKKELKVQHENLIRQIQDTEASIEKHQDMVINSPWSRLIPLIHILEAIPDSKNNSSESSNELHDLVEELENLKSELTKIQRDREDSQNDYRQIHSKLSILRNSLDEIVNAQRNLKNTSGDYELKLKEEAFLAKKLESCEKNITEKNSELAELRKSYNELKQTQDAILNDNTKKLSKQQLYVSKLQAYNSEDERRNKDMQQTREEFAAIQEKLELIEEEISGKMHCLQDIRQSLSECEKELNQSSAYQRNIQDSRRYYKLQEDRHRLNNELESLDEPKALKLRDNYKKQTEQLNKEHIQLTKDRAECLGELRQMQFHIDQLRKELDTEYRDTEMLLKQKKVDVKVKEMTIDCLLIWAKAVGSAIIDFHQRKMKVLNEIINELWRSTYCGTDTEKILVKADATKLRGNQSYNYRVCMEKNGIEMEMRGRCSAGQRMLACIIIRLALAECFSCQCGILCLDEPTTNLDHETIRSLAEALSRIIEHRRQQSNFQFVIITHDEYFLRAMNCYSFADSFSRIYRDEYQKSKIMNVRIGELYD